MIKVMLVMHDNQGEYYRMNKTSFEKLPLVDQYIYNTDGTIYQVEEVISFAGYDSSKGFSVILVIKSVPQNEQVAQLYGLQIEELID
nr:hypothetical protein [Ligilactobacillus ceti]